MVSRARLVSHVIAFQRPKQIKNQEELEFAKQKEKKLERELDKVFSSSDPLACLH